jgi:3-hydroxy-4-methylanthranilate adenylyltransferase
MRAEVQWLARILRVQGIRAGSTVAVHGTPSLTQIWCILAIWSLGAQALLFDHRAGGLEFQLLLGECAPQFLLTLRAPVKHTDAFTDQCEVLVRRLSGGRPMHSSHCVVQFTSGTTGRPKAIGRTPESLLYELDRLARLPGMPTAGERVVSLEPVTRSFGLIVGVLHSLAVGAISVFPNGSSVTATAAAAARADVLLGNPRHFRQLAFAAAELRMQRLRLAVSGGDVMLPEDAEAFRRRFGVRVGQAYGTTETGLVAADLEGRYGPSNIGKPLNGVRIRVSEGVLEVHLAQSPYLYEDLGWFGGWLSTLDLADVDPTNGVLKLRGRLVGLS